jgi:transposase
MTGLVEYYGLQKIDLTLNWMYRLISGLVGTIEAMRGEAMIGRSNMVANIPGETARRAKAIFGRRNLYILVGENWEAVLGDVCLKNLPEPGCESLYFPLVTYFQFIEGLTDLQAVDAARTRIDWKFALHLPVNSPSFHESSLCRFRRKVVNDPSCQQELQALLVQLLTFTYSAYSKPQTLDVPVLLSAICSVNRLSWALQTMQESLEALAGTNPDWLRRIALPHWYGRYNHGAPGLDPDASPWRSENSLREIGNDIQYLLGEIRKFASPQMDELREIRKLQHTWRWMFEPRPPAPTTEPAIPDWLGCSSCPQYRL